jgi:hypothetical protein
LKDLTKTAWLGLFFLAALFLVSDWAWEQTFPLVSEGLGQQQ